MLADDVLGALSALRQLEESLMVTPCVVTRDGPPVLDENTGNYTPSTTTVFTGSCNVVKTEAVVRNAESGSAPLVIQRYEVRVPVNSGSFQDKDTVTIPDRTFRVEGLDLETWQTAQHLPVVEVI